jgi:sugar (pentulose or hexulose) kinase
MFIGPAVFDLRRIALRRPGGILFPFPTLHVRPSAAELMCGFYESLAFALRANLEQLQEVWRQPISRVVVSGGMVHNPTLLRTLAAVLPSPVLVANQPQSAALGCALLMMSGGKEETLRALMRSLPEPHAVSGETRDPDRYEARYRTWKQLHDQLFELEI